MTAAMSREAAHAAIVLILSDVPAGYRFTDVADDILDALWPDEPAGSSTHPINEEDLKIGYFHVSSDPVNQGPRGVTLIHVPTGTVVHKWAERSRLENTARALHELRLILEDDEPPTEPP